MSNSNTSVEIDILLNDRASSALSGFSSHTAMVDGEVSDLLARIEDLEQELLQLQSIPTLELNQSENIAQIERVKQKIKELREELSRTPEQPLDLSLPNLNTAPVDQAKKSVSSLHMSIQQIAREMPALSVGPQMFFMAISNNLPIFADELKRARLEYQALKAAGQQAVPVWKQVVSSMFSWHTALTIGVTLLVMYGKELIEWIGSLSGAKEELKKLEEAKKRNIDIDRKAVEHAAEYRAELLQNINAIARFSGTKEEERQAVDKLNGQYGETFGYMRTLSEWYEVLKGKAEQYTEVLFLQHKQQLLINRSIELQGQIEELKQTDAKDVEGAYGWWGKFNQRMRQTLAGRGGVLVDADSLINEHDLNNKRSKLAELQKELDKTHESINALGEKEAGLSDALDTNKVPAGSLRDLDDQIALARKEYELADSNAKRAEIQKRLDKLKADRELIAIKEHKKRSGKTEAEKIEDDQRALEQARTKAYLEGQELLIEATKTDFDRQRGLAELEHQRQLADIDRREEELLRRQAALRKKGVKIPLSQDITVKTSAEQDRINAALIYKARIRKIDEQEVKDTQEKTDKLLSGYRTYAQERMNIELKYLEKVAELRRSGLANEDNEREAERVRNEAYEALDRKVAEREIAFKVLMSRISKMGIKQVRDLLREAETNLSLQEQNYGSNHESLAYYRAKVKALQDRLEALLAEKGLDDQDDEKKWERTHKALGKIKGTLSETASSMKGLDEATKSALQSALNVADSAIAMIDGIKTLSSAAAAEMGAMERASIVLTIIAAAFRVIDGIVNAGAETERRRTATMQAIQVARIKYQQEYNRLLAEQNLLYKEGESIFGRRDTAKALNALEQYRKAMEDYQRLLRGQEKISLGSDDDFKKYGMGRLHDHAQIRKKHQEAYQKGVGGLADIRVITGTHTEGWLWWQKTYDEYKSLLEIYPDLVDAQNNLNKESLKAIINNEKLAEGDRERLQSLLSSLETAEQAKGVFKSYMQETFGDLGKNMVSSVITAIREGKDALELFAQEVGKVFERMGERLLYSLFFAEGFKKLEKDIAEIYDRNAHLSEEEIDALIGSRLDRYFNEQRGNIRRSEDFARRYKEEASKRGYKIWDQNNGIDQKGRPGAFTTMTQDQGTKLEGMFTAGQVHWANIDAAVTDMLKRSDAWTDLLGRIVYNTSFTEKVYEELVRLRNEGIKVK